MALELDRGVFLELIPELNGLALGIDELKGGITNKLYRVRSYLGL